MNTTKIIIKIFIILILMNVIFSQGSYAAADVIEDGKDFLQAGDPIESVIDEGKLQETSSDIYKVLLSIAICVSVIIGAILGFQFILGSAEGKAKVSEALAPYIIGCIVVFGAFTIWKVAVNMGNKMESSYKPTYATTDFSKWSDDKIIETYKEQKIAEQIHDYNNNNQGRNDPYLGLGKNWFEFYRYTLNKGFLQKNGIDLKDIYK